MNPFKRDKGVSAQAQLERQQAEVEQQLGLFRAYKSCLAAFSDEKMVLLRKIKTNLSVRINELATTKKPIKDRVFKDLINNLEQLEKLLQLLFHFTEIGETPNRPPSTHAAKDEVRKKAALATAQDELCGYIRQLAEDCRCHIPEDTMEKLTLKYEKLKETLVPRQLKLKKNSRNTARVVERDVEEKAEAYSPELSAEEENNRQLLRTLNNYITFFNDLLKTETAYLTSRDGQKIQEEIQKIIAEVESTLRQRVIDDKRVNVERSLSSLNLILTTQVNNAREAQRSIIQAIDKIKKIKEDASQQRKKNECNDYRQSQLQPISDFLTCCNVEQPPSPLSNSPSYIKECLEQEQQLINGIREAHHTLMTQVEEVPSEHQDLTFDAYKTHVDAAIETLNKKKQQLERMLEELTTIRSVASSVLTQRARAKQTEIACAIETLQSFISESESPPSLLSDQLFPTFMFPTFINNASSANLSVRQMHEQYKLLDESQKKDLTFINDLIKNERAKKEEQQTQETSVLQKTFEKIKNELQKSDQQAIENDFFSLAADNDQYNLPYTLQRRAITLEGINNKIEQALLKTTNYQALTTIIEAIETERIRILDKYLAQKMKQLTAAIHQCSPDNQPRLQTLQVMANEYHAILQEEYASSYLLLADWKSVLCLTLCFEALQEKNIGFDANKRLSDEPVNGLSREERVKNHIDLRLIALEKLKAEFEAHKKTYTEAKEPQNAMDGARRSLNERLSTENIMNIADKNRNWFIRFIRKLFEFIRKSTANRTEQTLSKARDTFLNSPERKSSVSETSFSKLTARGV